MSLPTIDDLKAHANITTNDDDAELADMLDAAVDVVEGIVGPLGGTSVTEVHRGVRSDCLVLRRMPVESLTAISSRSWGSESALTLADYELDADTGIVRSVYGYGFCGDYVVTYTAGRTVLPAAIRLAVLVIAAHLWQTQRGPSPVGPLAEPDDTFGTPGAGFAIPNRARELLGPYARPVIA